MSRFNRGFFFCACIAWISLLGAAGVGQAQDNIPSCVGKKVEAIRFEVPIKLHEQDLFQGMALQVGKHFVPADLEKSLQYLGDKGIFDTVNYRLLCEDSVIVTFLPSLVVFITNVQFDGDLSFPEVVLQKETRIVYGVEYSDGLALTALANLENFYRKKGFNSAQITVTKYFRYVPSQYVLVFEIKEGRQSSVGMVLIDGSLPDEIEGLRDELYSLARNTPAAEDKIQELREWLLIRLRREGYIQASVEIESVEYLPDSTDVKLVLRVEPRKPVSLVFRGNKLFSADELTLPLKLEKRTVPFTPHALQSLCTDIVKLYQQEGYFFAKASYRQIKEEERRDIYEIDINEGPQTRIADIWFTGNSLVSDDRLRTIMKTRQAAVWPISLRQPGYLVTSYLADDLLAIENLYAQEGYAGTVADFEFVYNEKKGALDITIKITEGGGLRFEKVNVNFEPEQPATLSIKPMGIKQGDLYTPQKVEDGRVQLESAVQEQGYPNAKVKAHFDPDSKELNYVISAGSQIRLGKVLVSGNLYTRDKTILRQLAVGPGDLWNKQRISMSQQGLYRLGIFSRVSIEPADGVLDSDLEDLAVIVRERDTFNLQAGLGYNSEDGIQLQLGLNEQNVGGMADTLDFGFEGFFESGDRVLDAGRARTVYVNRNVLDTTLTQNVEGYAQFSVQLFDDYSYDRFGAATSISNLLIDSLKLEGGLNYFYEDLFDVAPDIIIGPDDEGDASYGILSLSLSFDRRDNIFNPRTGTYSTVGAQLSPETLGTATSFYGLSAQQNVYFELASKLVWANGARYTFLKPLDNDSVIPLARRQFLGGRTSVRGYGRNSIGPRGFDGNVVGGDNSILVNTELQWEVDEDVIFLLFFDAGSVYLEEKGTFTGDALSAGDFKYSPGIGFSYRTPIGPLSVTWGVPVDDPERDSAGRFNIGIGNIF